MSPAQIKRDPVSALISAIANGKTYIPRARTAYQLWSKTQFDKDIKTDVDQSVIDNGVDAKSGRIRLVTGSTQQAFQNLPASERRVWELQAAAEKAPNQEARGLQKKDGIIPQTCLDPVATQEYVFSAHFLPRYSCSLRLLDGLVHKMDPLLKGISMLTSGNTHFYWAGPEPRRGGQINVLSYVLLTALVTYDADNLIACMRAMTGHLSHATSWRQAGVKLLAVDGLLRRR